VLSVSENILYLIFMIEARPIARGGEMTIAEFKKAMGFSK
jgi:hypothetical protein